MARKGTAVEVDGISVTVDIDIADDFEITEQAAIANDPYSTASERMSATIRVYKLMLGSDYRRVKDELRKKNGGRLTNATMIAFISDVIAEVGAAKNFGGSDGR